MYFLSCFEILYYLRPPVICNLNQIYMVLTFNNVTSMKTRILLLTLIGLFSTSALFSQVSFYWEPYVFHNYQTLAEAGGSAEVFNLSEAGNGFSDYVTWRLYIEVDDGDPNIPDYVVSITGDGNELSEEVAPLLINFDCCPYQAPNSVLGGWLYNPIFDQFAPEMAFDSWITLGAENVDTPGANGINVLEGSYDGVGPDLGGADPGIPDAWIEPFETCPDATAGGLTMNSFNGGGWFILPDIIGNPNGITDENNRVLIAQFTLPLGCNLNTPASLCCAYFTDSDTSPLEPENGCFEINQPDPCFNSPIFPEVLNVDSASCFGFNDGLVQVSSNIHPDTLEITINTVDFTDEGYGTFGSLNAGDYEITYTDLYLIGSDGNNCSTTQVITVEQPDSAVEAILTVFEDVQCPGDSTGVVQIEVSGGTPFTIGEPYIVTTDFNVFSEMITPTVFEFDSLDASPGINFTVTDSLGCEVNFTQELGPPGGLVVTLDALSDVTCNGAEDGTILLEVTGGGVNPEFVWTPNVSDGISATDLAPGMYSVIINDFINCEIELEFEITEPDPLVISNVVPFNLDCFGVCNGDITFEVAGGVEPYTTTFVQNGNVVLSGELCAGDTQVNVTDANGCFASTSIQISQNPEILFNGVITDIMCPNGTDGIMDFSNISGGIGPFDLDIFPLIAEDANHIYFDVSANTYTITATDDIGCTKDTVIVMTQPNDFIINVTTTDVICNGDEDGTLTGEVIGGSGVITYCLDDECNQTGEFTGLAPGAYTLTGSDEAGCLFTADESVVIAEPPLLEVTSLTITPPGCGGECSASAAVTVDGGTPDYIYSWNGNAPSASVVTGLCAGPNSINITDFNGCVLDSLFEIDEPTPIEIVINTQNVTCTGMCDGSFLVAATGEGQVDVNFGNISNDEVCEGEYPVVATDSLGCIALDTISIGANIISDIEFTVFTTPVSCWNEADGTATIAVTGGTGEIIYEWSDADSQNTATAIGLVEDFYTVTITDEIGCTFTEDLFIEPTVGCFFVATALTPNSDGYNDEWTIGGLEYYPDAKVEVFNRWGQQVFESIGNYTAWDGKYNSNRLPVADYYYVITFDPDSPPLTGTVTLKY